MIQYCIENDLYQIKQLQAHLKKLYEMRSKELKENYDITEEEWEYEIQQLKKEKNYDIK